MQIVFWVLALLCVAIFGGTGASAASPVQTVTLADFEGTLPTAVEATQANSPAGGRTYSAASFVTESGSKRLKMTDPGGAYNGIVLSLPASFPEPGYYMITADVKVDNSSRPISTFGMAARVGGPDTARILDINAGYVMNLAQYPSTAASLGYQRIGAGINVPSGGTFPKELTLYFSSDPSGSPTDGHGKFTGPHRGSAETWGVQPPSNTNAVYIDNIQRIGPGSYGEERHAWISVGDSMTNLSTLNQRITDAYNNGFNCIDILVRYRANHYYTPNRDVYSGPNNEPYVSGSSAANDPIQFAIDRGHELGMRVYGSFSTFLMTDGSNLYPSYLPANSRTYMYNGPNTYPIPQTTDHDGEGIWADAGLSAMHDYTKNIVVDLVRNYDLDGIIFDRMRYQGTSFGYNPTALTEMGYDPNHPPAPTDAGFIAARQRRVTEFLDLMYKSITDEKPWMIVGTVPIAYVTNFQDTYKRVMQHWPMWSAAPSHNRVTSFGAQDIIQPQFYRQWDSGGVNAAPSANRVLMTKGIYGDTATEPMDYGLMPGSNVNFAPLFATLTISDTTDAINTANAIAINICDTQTPGSPVNGSGIYSVKGIFDIPSGQSQNVISRIRAATTDCGPDVMMPRAPLSDFLMKAGWDNTPPLGVTGASAAGNGYFANLTWTAPAPAADGESAAHYRIYASMSSTVKPTYANRLSPAGHITGTSYTAGPFPNAGNYYFRIVPVDDYNNEGPSSVVGPVNLNTASAIVESRKPDQGRTSPPAYQESVTMSYTSSKSTLPELTGDGASFSTSLGMIATFRPTLPVAGGYDVYVTMGSGTNNNADATFTITGTGSPVTGTVALRNSNSALVNKWYLLASNVSFAAGSTGSVAFQNVNGNNSNGGRFVMDAVKFQLATSSVADWQLY